MAALRSSTMSPPAVLKTAGVTDQASGTVYAYLAPLCVYSYPSLVLTSTEMLPALPEGGARHSTTVDDTSCPARVPSRPKRHTTLPVSGKLSPTHVTTLPPVAGPLEGRRPKREACDTYQKTLRSSVKSAPMLPLTSTAADPCARGGVLATTRVEDTSLPSTAPAPPKRTRHEPLHDRSLPTTLTTVPPPSLPALGTRRATVGQGTYSKTADPTSSDPEPSDTPPRCSRTVTSPGVRTGGAPAMTAVSDASNVRAAEVPKVTEETPWSLGDAPVMVTRVPPRRGPELGSTPRVRPERT
mmetsp:Transcript_27135/g.68855  ORF Transcript_27135/g.68855 Transcript_27135/m.68855 type:complete len:298 (+) Transcript_27135:350-1243(+)